MRRLLTVLPLAGLLMLASQAGCGPTTKTPPGADEFEGLKKEFEDAKTKYDEARQKALDVLDNAATEEGKAEARKELVALDADGLRKFSGRFLDFAAKH